MATRNQLIATTCFVATLGVAIGTVFSFTDTALAQRVVTCESENNQFNSCAINTENGVRLVRQLSDASCQGNWGYGRRNRVWVKNGCRAEFVSRIRPSSRYRY